MYVKIPARNHTLNVREKPDTGAVTLEKLHTGAEVSVDSIENDRTKIKSAAGTVGYVSSRYLSEEKP